MRRGIIAASVFAAGLATTACTDRSTGSPLAPQASIAGVSCEFSRMRADASAYFSSPQDPVFELIRFMQAAAAGGAAAATPAGLDILARIEKAFTDTRFPINPGSSIPQVGAQLVRDVMACSTLAAPAGMSPATLIAELTKALGPKGLFAVRGDAATGGDAVVARGFSVAPWGAEPQPGRTWLQVTTTTPNFPAGQRFLTYGYETSTTQVAFKLFTIGQQVSPVAFSESVRVGACESDNAADRVQHKAAMLALEALDFCNRFAAIRSPTGTGLLASVQRLWRVLMPQPLYAATLSALGGVGGKASDYSPFFIGPASPTITFTTQPGNGTVNSNNLVRLWIRSPSLDPLAPSGTLVPVVGVSVQLQVSGGSGGFTAINVGPITTGAEGVAAFPAFQINQPGTYTVRGTMTDASLVVISVPSNPFTLIP